MEERIRFDNGNIENQAILEINDKAVATLESTTDTKSFNDLVIEPWVPVARPWSVKQVRGKEYSDNADKDTNGLPDPGQTLLWAGDGSTSNGADYPTGGQVDAMANSGDAYFNYLVEDKAAMLFSTTYEDQIRYELPQVPFSRVWANKDQIDQPGPSIDQGVHDVDALEVWGPENYSDATYYSVYGDVTFDPLTNNVVSGAVFDQNNNVIFTREEIAKAVGDVTQINPEKLLGYVNVDAMVVSGRRIVFSIDSIPELGLDGGEIFVYDQWTGASNFLSHGGHIWDTDFDIMGKYGTLTENINALEVVPVHSFLDSEPAIDTFLDSEAVITHDSVIF
ncbi:hypothetical protein [Dapis sp. BLCC M229]|uniref:hypothetical protein n=1 Tax=Dapis sp. BLCC M229 TaxID=3400188 RepID=UPI003CF7595C